MKTLYISITPDFNISLMVYDLEQSGGKPIYREYLPIVFDDNGKEVNNSEHYFLTNVLNELKDIEFIDGYTLGCQYPSIALNSVERLDKAIAAYSLAKKIIECLNFKKDDSERDDFYDYIKLDDPKDMYRNYDNIKYKIQSILKRKYERSNNDKLFAIPYIDGGYIYGYSNPKIVGLENHMITLQYHNNYIDIFDTFNKHIIAAIDNRSFKNYDIFFSEISYLPIMKLINAVYYDKMII